jgi:hypothetical protein
MNPRYATKRRRRRRRRGNVPQEKGKPAVGMCGLVQQRSAIGCGILFFCCASSQIRKPRQVKRNNDLR